MAAISELPLGQHGAIVGRLNSKSDVLTYTKGKGGKYFHFTVFDSKGTLNKGVSFNDCLYDQLQIGNTYTFEQVQINVNKYTKQRQVVLSSSSTVSDEDNEIVDNIAFTSISEIPTLKAQTPNIMCVCSSPHNTKKIVTKEGKTLALHKTQLTDKTGTLTVCKWEENFNFSEGDVVSIQGLSIKKFRGQIEGNLTKDSVIDVNPENAEELYKWFNERPTDMPSLNISSCIFDDEPVSDDDLEGTLVRDDIEAELSDVRAESSWIPGEIDRLNTRAEQLARKRRRLQKELEEAGKRKRV